METRDKIIEIIKIKGPVLPVQISKEIGSNILMASAHLAELTASSKLKISTIKVGGSPLYYLAGQESMLQKYTGNMNDKEKKAFDLLSQNKVLKDSEQEPVVRVALREIKDFAKPLSVNYNNSKEIFWKWYLASNEEAEQLIKSQLRILEKPAENKIDEKSAEKAQQESKEQQKTEEKPMQQTQKQLKEKKESDASELANGERALRASQVTRTRSQVTRKYKKRETEDIFLKDILRFFEKNKIGIIDTETIKKNSEIDFIVEIPSVVGNLQYYCKAKNKKRVSDSDLSNAYVKGQFKKLPVILIAPGDLSAKAQDMAGKELKNLTFKKI
ncbi:hypothetical protein HYW20_08625 [Candidatus Woesearchaeota archaeon]|nr:hypothetical protein [Candidatus Woesearchaeota archaeon]